MARARVGDQLTDVGDQRAHASSRYRAAFPGAQLPPPDAVTRVLLPRPAGFLPRSHPAWEPRAGQMVLVAENLDFRSVDLDGALGQAEPEPVDHAAGTGQVAAAAPSVTNSGAKCSVRG